MKQRSVIVISGVSDDLVNVDVIEGDKRLADEFDCSVDAARYVELSTGDVLLVRYDVDGIWRIEHRSSGSAKVELLPIEDSLCHSERARVEGEIEWINFWQSWPPDACELQRKIEGELALSDVEDVETLRDIHDTLLKRRKLPKLRGMDRPMADMFGHEIEKPNGDKVLRYGHVHSAILGGQHCRIGYDPESQVLYFADVGTFDKVPLPVDAIESCARTLEHEAEVVVAGRREYRSMSLESRNELALGLKRVALEIRKPENRVLAMQLAVLEHDRVESPVNGDLICLPGCGACERGKP